jgi:hypothetical protein
MNRAFSVGLVLVLLAPVTAPAVADSSAAGPPAASETGPRLLAPAFRSRTALEQWRFRFIAPDTTGRGPVVTSEAAAFSLNRFGDAPVVDLYRPGSYRLSRFECALRGAGAGMNFGFLLGSLAQEFGAAPNDRFRWYLGAAAAATGAIFGGTLGAEDSRWNVGIDWGPTQERRLE